MSRGRKNTSNRTTDLDRHQVDNGKRIEARGTAQTLSRKKCTIFFKPLDKLHKVWYNIDTKEREEYTMAKTVKRTMYYPTFNKKENQFDYEEVIHERAMTKQERKADLVSTIFWWISIIAISFSLVLFIIGCAGNFEILGLSALGAFVIFSVLTALLDRLWIEKKIYPILEVMGDYGFDIEILQWEQQTQEQNLIAEKWRAEHEFEELIRKAKLSANCNDIAQAARYYAEHYINK